MEKRLTPMQAIRQKCIDCCCGNKSEVRNCTAEKCSLFVYRMGHSPYRKKNKQPIPAPAQ